MLRDDVEEQNREFLHMCEYYAAVLGGEYVLRDNLAIGWCGVRNLTFNTAALARPVASDGELAFAINASVAYFADRDVEWSFVLCDSYVPDEMRASVARSFAAHEMEWFWGVTGMVTDAIAETSRAAPELTFREVEDEHTAFAVLDINARAYGIEREWFTEVLLNPKLWTERHVGYVGYAGGRAVATAVVYRGESAAGLYWVATDPEVQGAGYAEAATRYAIAQARRMWAIERTILQSTDRGLPLYRRLGFREVTRFDYYSE